ncbi:unnamed protein product [Spirodela intermedia]|uniref:Uncharacterized protein n=1 Tax=Spirodela intermedia TaxID=51605 RepID=A0A7I8JHP9_SPIIN|nr:unnamed protein product [Spirodela intermedia]CAA6669073.1 unnamed protein product [Spirodela intermedia]
MESRSVQSQDVSPSRCRKNEGQVENLRIQLRQLAEEFTRFEAWGSKRTKALTPYRRRRRRTTTDDDDDEEDRDNPFRTPSTERESSREEESCDQEQDQFNSTRISQTKSQFQSPPATSASKGYHLPHISIEKRESDDGQIEQVR